MNDIKLDASALDAIFGDEGRLVVSLLSDPSGPLPRGSALRLGFETGLSNEIKLGSSSSVTLGLDAKTEATLLPILSPPGPAEIMLLKGFGLEGHFQGGANANQVVLVLEIGGELTGSAAAKSQVSPVLTVEASLKAGVDGRFGLARAFGDDVPARDLMRTFFGDLRLPAMLTKPPAAAEVIVLEYGGRLTVGAGIGVGYELAGSASTRLGELELSEKYELGVLGKVAFEGTIAGGFRIEARAADQQGWVRVVVRKIRQRAMSIAADVNVGVEWASQGLPESPNEFLEATLGLRAKNWLNLLEEAQKYTSFADLDTHLDTLAKSYIEKFTGAAFESLQGAALQKLLADVKNMAKSYAELENSAIEIFDRFYDAKTRKLDAGIRKQLQRLGKLTDVEQLRGELLGEDVGQLLYLLTDGDPLRWLGESLDPLAELRKGVEGVFELVEGEAHESIRAAIGTAKEHFALDELIGDLSTLADPATLQDAANRRLLGFAQRLTDQALDQLEASELGDAINQVNAALKKVDAFKTSLYQKVREALNSSFHVGLQLAHNRATEREALIDVEINLTKPAGRALMRAAGHGQFAMVLAEPDPKIVRIRSGRLVTEISRRTKLGFSISGWHKAFKYQGMRQLLVRSDQIIQTDPNGLLTIDTTVKMDTSHERRRNRERLYTNLALAFIGSSKGAVRFDKETERYLIDVLTRITASYQLVFEDDQTTPKELAQYLSFADDFGLAKSDVEAMESIEPLLLRDEQGGYGWTSFSYDVRFAEEGLKALLAEGLPSTTLRRCVRRLVLANYLRRGGEHWKSTGWCYWTEAIRELWRKDPLSFATATSPKEFKPIAPSPFAELEAPPKVVLYPKGQQLLNVLYRIEGNLVDAFADLHDLIQSGVSLAPREYEQALSKFGSLLHRYDTFDMADNSFFALLDAWIAASGKEAVRASSLTIKGKAGDKETTKMLFAPARDARG